MVVTVSNWAQDPETKESGWRHGLDIQGASCVPHAVLIHLAHFAVKDAVISGDLFVEPLVVEVSSRLKCARWRFEEKKP